MTEFLLAPAGNAATRRIDRASPALDERPTSQASDYGSRWLRKNVEATGEDRYSGNLMRQNQQKRTAHRRFRPEGLNKL
jgi:hypothetical protein